MKFQHTITRLFRWRQGSSLTHVRSFFLSGASHSMCATIDDYQTIETNVYLCWRLCMLLHCVLGRRDVCARRRRGGAERALGTSTLAQEFTVKVSNSCLVGEERGSRQCEAFSSKLPPREKESQRGDRGGVNEAIRDRDPVPWSEICHFPLGNTVVIAPARKASKRRHDRFPIPKRVLNHRVTYTRHEILWKASRR